MVRVRPVPLGAGRTALRGPFDGHRLAGGGRTGGNALTSEFKINYLRPAVGTLLVGRSVATHVGKRQAVCQCEIFAVQGDEETLCAIAQGTVVSTRS